MILDLGGRHLDEPDKWEWPQVTTGPYEVRVQDEDGAVVAEDEAFVEGGREEELTLRPCS